MWLQYWIYSEWCKLHRYLSTTHNPPSRTVPPLFKFEMKLIFYNKQESLFICLFILKQRRSFSANIYKIQGVNEGFGLGSLGTRVGEILLKIALTHPNDKNENLDISTF